MLHTEAQCPWFSGSRDEVSQRFQNLQQADFLVTVKAAPNECLIMTGVP